MLQHEGVMGEMLDAAGQIGDAFSGMVTNARQSGDASLPIQRNNTKEMKIYSPTLLVHVY